MDKETLIKKLDELGVYTSYYSLTSDTNPDCISVVGFANQWPVVYTDEKGEKKLLTKFNSKEEAYDYIYNFFVRQKEFKKI